MSYMYGSHGMIHKQFASVIVKWVAHFIAEETNKGD